MNSLPRRFASIVLAGAVAFSCAVVACSNQGEGDRCDAAGSNPGDGRPNGSGDCQSNLVCTKKSELGTNFDACCPADRTTSTTPTCAIARAAIGDSGIPDSSASVDATSDATSDAAPAQDSAADAPSDAPADGG